MPPRCFFTFPYGRDWMKEELRSAAFLTVLTRRLRIP